MKTKFFTTLLLSAILGLNYEMPKDVEVVSANEITDGSRAIEYFQTGGREIGYTINLAKHEFVEHDKINIYPVFATNWLQTVPRTYTEMRYNLSRTRVGSSIEEMAYLLERNASLVSDISQGYSVFMASAADRFNNTEYMNYSDHIYQYYSTFNYKMKGYSYELPDYQTNPDLYRSKYNIAYKNDMRALFSGSMTSTEFFDKYGTHIIAKAQYGGKFEINYSLVSDRYYLWEDYNEELYDYLAANLHNKVGQNVDINVDVFEHFDFWENWEYETLQIHTKGGNESSSISLDNLYEAFTTWKESVYSNPKIIAASGDGLIPLWDLMPTDFNNEGYRSAFIRKYQEYARMHEATIKEKYTPSILSQERVPTGYQILRTGETIVTDEGYFNNDYDVVDLNEDFDIKYNYMKQHGYTKMDIYINMEMREINMGYQWIAIYYSEKESNSYKIDEFTYEYKGTSFGGEYDSSITFARFEVPIETFENDDPDDCYKIVFRYDASGTGEDDWANRRIYAQVVYVK